MYTALVIISSLCSYWIFFTFKSHSPGREDPWSAYLNMEAMFWFFLATVLCLLFLPLKKAKLPSWLLLYLILMAFPFVFVLSNPHNLIHSPKPGDFAYLDGIHEAVGRSWMSILTDPWSLLPSDWPDLPDFGGPFALAQLNRTKMPGFAVTAKLLSYVVTTDLSFLAICGTVAALSGIILGRALLSEHTDLWPILGVIPVNTFLIWPVGVEALCTLFFALCLWLVWRFQQTGKSWYVAATAVLGGFLVLDLSATVHVLPFIAVFALWGNRYWLKLLLVFAGCATLIVFLLNWWFHWSSGMSIFLYFHQVSINTEVSYRGRSDELNVWWKLLSAVILSNIVLGPAFILGFIAMIRRPLAKWALLFLASAGPVFAYSYFTPLSEAYRQAHLNSVAATFSVVGMIVEADVFRRVWKILYAGTVLSAVTFGKLYAAPVVRLDPFVVRDLPPHPDHGGWDYRIIQGQSVSSEAFVVAFLCFVMALFWRVEGHDAGDSIKMVLDDSRGSA